MIFVWGKKQVRKRLGLAADFCPICRDVQGFVVFRLGVASHVNYIALGQGRLTGYERECLACKARLDADPDTYQSLARKRPDGLPELVDSTYPDLLQEYEERLQVEADLVAGKPISEEWRAKLLRESFNIYSARAETRLTGDTHFDRWAVLSAVATLVVPITLFVGVETYEVSQGTDDLLLASAGILFLAGGLLTLILAFTSPGRWIRRVVLPQLAKHIRPVRPTQEEIEQQLESLRTKGYKFARKFRAERLYQAVQVSDPHNDYAPLEQPSQAPTSALPAQPHKELVQTP